MSSGSGGWEQWGNGYVFVNMREDLAEIQTNMLFVDFPDKEVLVGHCGVYGRYEFICSTSSLNSV